ncbi:MAG: hypothetical protein SPI97_08850, partial [Oscillospiraceae bacterium]|nr:hypothetical protein [Oscillospiraceae bacterium]
WFGDWREKDMTPIKIAQNKGTMHGKIQNIDTGWTINIPGKANNETKTHKSIVSRKAVDYLPYLNDIVKNAILLDSFGSDKGGESLMMHSLYAVADIGNGPEVLKLYVEELNNVNSNETIKRTYMLQNIEKQLGSVSSQNKSASLVAPTAINNISNLYYFVKLYDKNFNPTSSSKVVNVDGTPKIMYHGSPNSFTAFDKKKAKASGLYGKGFYFTDSESSSNSRGSNNSNNALRDDTASNTRLSQKDTSVNANSMQNSQKDASKKIESRKDIDDSVQSQEFKNWFGDWQNDSENASKVVNSDGTPKIMYHGSLNSFTAFDKKKTKASGLYGKGFYFTDSEGHAGQYGDKYAVYLNIKSPLELGKNNLTKKQLMNSLEAVAAFAAGKDKIEIKALYNDIEKLDKIRDILADDFDMFE